MAKKYLIHIILLCSSLLMNTLLFAQLYDEKKLLNELDKYLQSPELPKDTNYINIINDLAAEYLYSKTAQTYTYASEAIQLSTKLSYPKGETIATRVLGTYYILKGNFTLAESQLQKALSMALKYGLKQVEQKIYNNLGVLYSYTGDYDSALKNYFKSLQFSISAHDSINMALSYGNIAYFYNERGHYYKALDFLFKEQTIRRAIQQDNEAVLYNTIGLVYKNIKKYDSALYYLNYALILAKSNEDKYVESAILVDEGGTYLALNELSKANTCFLKALSLQKSIDDEWGMMGSYAGLCAMANLTKHPVEAIKWAKLGYALALKTNSKQKIVDFSGILYRNFEAQKRMPEAFQYLKIHKLYADSLFNDAKSKEIGRLEAAHAYDEKENERIKLQKANEQVAHQQELKLLRNINILIVLAIAFAFLAVLFFIKRQQKIIANRVLLQKNTEIAAQNKILEHQNLLIKQQAQQLQQNDAFKNKLFSIISHDLRAPLASLSTAVDLYNQGLLNEEESKLVFAALNTDLGYTNDLLNNLLHWGKNQMNGLVFKKDSVDIKKIIKDNVNLIASRALNKQISFELNLSSEALIAYVDSNTISIVVRNILSNALKFCKPNGIIQISATHIQNMVSVSIQDNGIGITPENLGKLFGKSNFTTQGTQGEKGTGLGLILCKEFVEKNEGTIHVSSTLGSGTLIVFTVPAV